MTRLLALNSGGIDSPVATHRMLSGDNTVDVLIFDNQPFTDSDDKETAYRTVQQLAEEHDETITCYTVQHGLIQEHFLDSVEETDLKYLCLFSRRMMMRIAGRLAEKHGYDGLVTGDNIGQVASQTLDNLAVIDDACSHHVYRPLLGFDKKQISSEARDIGTYEISIGGGISCAVNPIRPETHAQIKDIKDVESGFDIPTLIDEALATLQKREMSP